MVSPAVVLYQIGTGYTLLAGAMGKMIYNLYQTSISSVIHWILAFQLLDKFENKMMGISIATTVHFLCRFLIAYTFVTKDEKVK